MTDWKTYVTDWLRRAAPDDVGNVYLLGSDEVPPCDWGDLRCDYAGYTHPALDVRHEALLAARAEWRGRGFCAVIDDDLPQNAKAATVVHELAHYLRDKADVLTETLLIVDSAEIAARPRLASLSTSPIEFGTPVVQQEYHDLAWCRACCHLIHRLQNLGVNVHPSDVGVCGDVLSEREYLGNDLFRAFEPEYSEAGSIVPILRTTPSPEAVAVWEKYQCSKQSEGKS
jgi:hypothetical protein